MNGAIKLLSRILKISKTLKILEKKEIKFLFSKIVIGTFLIFKKNGINVKEPYQVYMCTQFQVDILKNNQLWHFEGRK